MLSTLGDVDVAAVMTAVHHPLHRLHRHRLHHLRRHLLNRHQKKALVVILVIDTHHRPQRHLPKAHWRIKKVYRRLIRRQQNHQVCLQLL